MRQRRRVGGNCVKDSGRRWEETRDNVASRHGDMATVPHSPATAPRAELIETIVRKHSVSFVLWRGTAPAAACSTVSPAPTLHSLLLLAFSVIKVLYHYYCSSVGIHEKQIQIWSIRFDNDQFEGSVCEPVLGVMTSPGFVRVLPSIIIVAPCLWS